MPLIRFTAAPKLPRDLTHLGYTQGTEVELTDDQAARWLRRGVAEVVSDDEIEARRRAAEKVGRDAAAKRAADEKAAADAKAKADADAKAAADKAAAEKAADTAGGADTMPAGNRARR